MIVQHRRRHFLLLPIFRLHDCLTWSFLDCIHFLDCIVSSKRRSQNTSFLSTGLGHHDIERKHEMRGAGAIVSGSALPRRR